MSGEPVLVRSGVTEFYVEVAGSGPGTSGVGTVALNDVLSFRGIRDTIAAVAEELAESWERAKPNEAKVEFGLRLIAKTGKLTGLLVDGGGEATLKISLTWTEKPPPAPVQ